MNRILLPLSLLLGALALHCDRSSADERQAIGTAATPPPPAPKPVAPTPAAAPAAGRIARIPSDRINPAGKSVADRIAKAYANGLKTGAFADTGDISDDLKKVTSAQWQQVFAATKAKYGSDKSMVFADAWNDEKGGTMYRYKAAFTKKDEVEFRVDLNGNNVATRFGSYDWMEGTP